MGGYSGEGRVKLSGESEPERRAVADAISGMMDTSFRVGKRHNMLFANCRRTQTASL